MLNVELCMTGAVYLQAAQASIAVGSQVWVEDPDVAWIDGEVVKVHGDTITVKCSNEDTVCCCYRACQLVLDLRKLGCLELPCEVRNRQDTNMFVVRACILSRACYSIQVTANASDVHAKDPEEAPCGVDDMTKLAYLHEPGVLQNLKSRYDMNEIYVSSNS
jgi:myosin V